MLTCVASLAQYQIRRWGSIVLEFTLISKPFKKVAEETLAVVERVLHGQQGPVGDDHKWCEFTRRCVPSQTDMILTSWSGLFVHVTPFLLERLGCRVRGKTSFSIVRLHIHSDHPQNSTLANMSCDAGGTDAATRFPCSAWPRVSRSLLPRLVSVSRTRQFNVTLLDGGAMDLFGSRRHS